MNKHIALMLSLLATSVVVGCGSSDGNAAGSGNCSGPEGSMSSAECLSCVKGSCGSQYSNYCSGNCGANASTSSCQNAAVEIGTCVIEHCSSECDTGVDNTAGNGSGGASTSGGGGNSAGQTSSAGSGGASTPTAPNCVKLEECCGTLPGEQVQGPCFQAAGYNNDGPCLNLLKAYQNGGSCKEGAMPDETVACIAGDTCTKQKLPASSAATYKAGCTMGNGTVSDACPSENVQGCCTISTVEVCSYADGGLSEMDCTSSGGKYSATP